MADADEDLCIGDVVCLYSEDTRGFVFGRQSSSVHNELGVAAGQNQLQPDVACIATVQLLVCGPNRYKESKKYLRARVEANAHTKSFSLKAKADEAQERARSEDADNTAEQIRQRGKSLYYGQLIQLQHVFTGKYFHINTTQTSWTESSNLLLELRPENGKGALFRLLPKGKVKSEGDLVQIGDLIVLESVKSPGTYLHCSRERFGEAMIYRNSYELNVSVVPSGFTVVRSRRANDNDPVVVKGGTVLQLFHKEVEGYMTAEGVFDAPIVEDVHLRRRPMTATKHKSLLPPTSAITYWAVEKESSAIDCSRLIWEDRIRLQHLTTRQFLMIDRDGRVALTQARDDPMTVFRFFHVSKRSNTVQDRSFLRIQHVMTATWLHASPNEPYVCKSRRKDTHASAAGTALRWSRAPLLCLRGNDQMMYDDAYTLYVPPAENVALCYVVAGMVPFLKALVAEFTECDDFPPRRMFRVAAALEQLQPFMMVKGVADKLRQKLLRDFKVVDLLVDLLQCQPNCRRNQDFANKVHTESYAILQVYLEGYSAKNELYLAKHLEFFLDQLSHEGDVGLKAAHMLMELLRDNRSIIDLTTHSQIIRFVDLLAHNKNKFYLELLSVLCVAKDVTLPRNQAFIAKHWLVEFPKAGKNVLNYLAVGEAIGLKEDVCYISTDLRRTWIPLLDFMSKVDGVTDDQISFLQCQLELFSVLCRGRNAKAIEIVTGGTAPLLAAAVPLRVLQGGEFADGLRAVCAAVVQHAFVDVGFNYPVMDRVNLVVAYGAVRAPDAARPKRDSMPAEAVPLPFVKQLKRWLAAFLDANKEMVAARQATARNRLLEAVVRLVHCLVDFGYFGDTEDVQQLCAPLLSLIDGRIDRPFPLAKHAPITSTLQQQVAVFKERKRFRKSFVNNAVADVKFQSMKVIELFLNFRFNTRINRFISEFKRVENSDKHNLAKFLTDDIDFRNDTGLHRVALKELLDMFKATDYFDDDFVSILKDLTHYEYEILVTEALSLLNRYFTTFEVLFQKCIDTQLLLSDKSLLHFKQISQGLPQFRLLKNNKLNPTTTQRMTEIMQEFTLMCCLESDVREPHSLNQEMLFNCGTLNDVVDVLTRFAADSDENAAVALTDAHQVALLKHALRFVKVFARGHAAVQSRLFDRLPFLVSIRSAEAELGEVLIEVFKESVENCLKVRPAFIKQLVARYVQNYHPVWLSVLCSMVVADVFPIKRNQNIVIKALMTYQDSLAILTKTTADDKLRLLQPDGAPPAKDGRQQLCSLVYLFSVCASGENKSIQSICQCVITMDDLLRYIALPDLCFGLRLPFVSFLLACYLTSASSSVRKEVDKCGSDGRLSAFLRQLVGALEDGAVVLRESGRSAVELLRQRPTNLHRSRQDVLHEKKETLHFLFDGALPLLTAVFERHWGFAVPADAQLAADLQSATLELADAARSVMTRAYQRSRLVAALQWMGHATNRPVAIASELYVRVDTATDGVDQYDDYYAAELQLNDRFDLFSANLLAAYEGKNSVLEQTGAALDRPYIDDSSDEPLPLGDEFQQMVRCFLVPPKQRAEHKFAVGGLVKHLSWSQSLSAGARETQRWELRKLDLKCMLLMRAFIHNELVQIPASRREERAAYDRAVAEARAVQVSLDRQQLVSAVLPHLKRADDAVVRECFNLFNALYKNNRDTPETFVEYVNGKHEEAFFIAVQDRLHTTAALVKEKRYMLGLHRRALLDGKTLLKTDGHRGSRWASGRTTPLPFASKPVADFQKVARGVLKAAWLANSGGGGALDDKDLDGVSKELHKSKGTADARSKTAVAREADERLRQAELEQNDDDEPVGELAVREVVSAAGGAPSDAADDGEEPQLEAYSDLGVVRVVLRTISSLCDLEYGKAQHLMREQPKNVKSVNVVAELCTYLSLLYTSASGEHVSLITELLETLVELVQVVDYLNSILRLGDDFTKCGVDDVIQLKGAIATLIRFLSEENQAPRDQASQSKMILSVVNKELLWKAARESFADLTNPSLSRSQSLESVKNGFLYYSLLRRAADLKLFKFATIESTAAWKFYESRTMSLEIVKNGLLQRLYFRVTDQSAFRNEVLDKLNWEVDRSSYGNKMRDFMLWTKDIHEDIRLQRRINSTFLGRFFVRSWKPINVIVLLLTILLNLFILAMWQAKEQRNGWQYHHTDLDLPWRVTGVLHCICSAALLLSYFLSNAAGLLASKRSHGRRLKKLLRRGSSDQHRTSKLESNIFGFQTLYYAAFFVFSVLGTVVSPAFFAFHLLQIVPNNQLLTRVIRAVTLNGRSLLWVGLLGVIIIYVYGLVAFMVIRDVFTANKMFCESLLQCTLSMFREGLIYRVMRIDYPVRATEYSQNEDFRMYSAKLLFDLSFFVVILIIGLNVIFGIIVDTFRQLRDAKWRIEQDMQANCFVCGRSSYEFEQKGISFRRHCTNEHSMIAYVFFLVRLQDLPIENLSHLEMYINQMVVDENNSFFPMGRAMSLDEGEVENSMERDFIMMGQLDNIVQRLDDEQNYRAQEARRQRQLEWISSKNNRDDDGARRRRHHSAERDAATVRRRRSPVRQLTATTSAGDRPARLLPNVPPRDARSAAFKSRHAIR